MKNAYEELLSELQEGEVVEAVVFGEYEGYEEDVKFSLVPIDRRNKVLSFGEAKQYMKGWSFKNGFGEPNCYAVYIWTNYRVFWVTQYDGSTELNSMPRNPIDCVPGMPGGG